MYINYCRGRIIKYFLIQNELRANSEMCAPITILDLKHDCNAQKRHTPSPIYTRLCMAMMLAITLFTSRYLYYSGGNFKNILSRRQPAKKSDEKQN